jgi:hypothetical protein
MGEMSHDKAPARMHEPRGMVSRPQQIGSDSAEVTTIDARPLGAKPFVIESVKGNSAKDDDPTRLVVRDDAKGKLTVLVNEAIAKWPGFKENMAEIGALVQRPENVAKGMSLYQAYIEVVPNKLVQDTAAKVTAAEKAMTEKLQQRVPKESIRPGSTPVAKASADDSKTDMESVIRASMKSAGLSAA